MKRLLCGFCECDMGDEAPSQRGRRRVYHQDTCRRNAGRLTARYRLLVKFIVFATLGRPWPAEWPRPRGAPVFERLVREAMSDAR